MRNLPRATAPLAVAVALAASLSACGDDSEPTAGPDGGDMTSQTCRLAAVTHASLAGPRASAVGGSFTAGMVTAYDTAIAGLSTAVAGEGEVAPEVTAAVVDQVAGYSRTRAYVQDSADAGSFLPSRAKALTAAEEGFYGELVAVCPALEDVEQG